MLDMTLHTAIVQRLDRCDQLIRGFKGPAQIRMDLKKLFATVHIEYVRLDNCLVECRRMRRFGSGYQLQYEKLEKLVTSLEKRITWACLM